MKKILTGVILVCLLCIGLVACPQHIAAETKDTGVFSGEVTLLKVLLVTGRTHQIRVQLSERGFPLVGDVKYGGPRCGDGLKLHAVRLRVGEETYTALPPWAGPWRVAHLPPEWEDV